MSDTHWAILKGSNSQHHLTQKKSHIGRDTNCNDVILLSQSISKKQCIINASNLSNIVLTDQNSRNGTFVNNKRIQNSTIKIKHGDIIRFGFDSNCYRLELKHKPPINSPPPQQHRFDDTRRNDKNNSYINKSHSAPSNIRRNINNDINKNNKLHSKYMKAENRSAGFMMGSPPISPMKTIIFDHNNNNNNDNKLIQDDELKLKSSQISGKSCNK
eukprot:408978_1